jgi:hypothetical protein
MTTSDVHDSTQPTLQPGVPAPPYDDGEEPAFRPRPRKRAHALTYVLAALVIAAAGYVVGVQVQKHDDKNSSSSASSIANRFRNAAAAAGTGTGTGTGAGRGGAGGGGGFGGGRTVGTVKLVDGKNVYITDASGNTIKISTNAGSQLSKTVAATVKDIAPNDTVIVSGTPNADGSITATSITISSASAGGGLFNFGGGG